MIINVSNHKNMKHFKRILTISAFSYYLYVTEVAAPIYIPWNLSILGEKLKLNLILHLEKIDNVNFIKFLVIRNKSCLQCKLTQNYKIYILWVMWFGCKWFGCMWFGC